MTTTLRDPVQETRRALREARAKNPLITERQARAFVCELREATIHEDHFRRMYWEHTHPKPEQVAVARDIGAPASEKVRPDLSAGMPRGRDPGAGSAPASCRKRLTDEERRERLREKWRKQKERYRADRDLLRPLVKPKGLNPDDWRNTLPPERRGAR